MKKNSLYDYKSYSILNTAFLGDVALTMHLPATIISVNPEARIQFVTTPAASSITKMSPFIREVVSFDKRKAQKGYSGIKDIAAKIDEFGTECLIVPHRSLRSTLIAYHTKSDAKIGFNKASISYLYTKRAKYKIHRHEIYRNYELLKKLQYCPDEPVLTGLVKYSDEIESKVDNIIKEINPYNDKKLIVLAPGSVWETKKWPEERFSELAGILLSNDFIPVLIGGAADEPVCELISSKSGAVNLCGKTTIPETINLLSKSKLLITNDSAPTHFAWLAGCPVIAIFGPTVPEFGFSPMSGTNAIMQNENLKCRPCAIHGSKECPLGTLECMTSITAGNVFIKMKELLEK